ncbi:TPA: YSIRK-type signal peptide-containing protein, partial [Streptococcus suis]
MSNRDKNMFRQEQRFSFRKYSFGLASALIATVAFGATITGGPTVHANTEVEAVSVSTASSEQPASEDTASETAIAETAPAATEAGTQAAALTLRVYEVRYVDETGQVIHKTAHIDQTNAQGIVVQANDIPEGYELAQDQSEYVAHTFTDEQVNVVTFVIVKKAEVKHVADKTVLEQVTSEADLLAAEALRQVATTQAGNTALEAAANATKELAAEAQAIFNDVEATQEVVDAKVEAVKASTKALHDEMLKVDEDGNVTAQLYVEATNTASVSTKQTYNVSYNENQLKDVPKFVNVTKMQIEGDQVTYEVIFNGTEYKRFMQPYMDVALSKYIDPSSIQVRRERRGDSQSLWIPDNSGNAWNTVSWIGNQRQYFGPSNIGGGTYAFNNARSRGGATDPVLNGTQFSHLFRDQVETGGWSYKYTVTGTISGNTNREDLWFMAGFRSGGSGTEEYYVATTHSMPDPDQPTRASDKQEIFVFQNTPIQTVNAGTAVPNRVDKVKIGTITDADVIQSITVTDGDPLGYSVDTDGNAYGTPNGPQGLGSYKRALNVTDKKGNTTEVFSRASGPDDRYVTYILSATADSNAIVFNNGQNADARKQAVLNKVVVGSGTASSVIEAGDKKYKKYIVDPATGQEAPLPTAAGDHTVTVRVVTASNVYKDVQVKITNPTNQAPIVTPITDETNVNVDGAKSQAIYVFGVSQGSTEDSNGATGTSPVADKNKATRKVAEISDPDGTISTIQYHDLRSSAPDLASPQGSTPALTVSKDGYLEGKLIYGPGAKSTRRLDVTDNGGAKTESTSFKVLGYTDKLANSTAIEKAFGARPTTQEIFSKLTIDVNSSYPNAYPATLEIPADQYTREVVGYRTITTASGTETKGALTTATADTLPTSGSYEVKVRTKNVYGQEIFNWVRVNHAENTPTTATDKQTIYVFNNTPIATVGDNSDVADNVNKVKVVTFTDPEGIKSVQIGEGGLGAEYKVDAEGYASGTPSVSALGKHGRSLVVTDNQDQVTNVLTATNDKQMVYVMDARATGEITKAVGESTTADEILAKVTVDPGNERAHIEGTADGNPKYLKVLAPGQQVPTTPGRHEVTVRVITDSNVYKDVVVVVNIPAVTVDPVDITDFEAGSNSVVLTPRSKTDQIFANVKGKSVKLVRQEDGTYAAQDNAANVTVTTDANGAITLTLPEGEKFAEGDRVVTRGENVASYEQDGFVKSSEVEKFATPD